MSKKKIAGIIGGCIIAIIVIVVIATSTPTYTLSVSVHPPEAGSVKIRVEIGSLTSGGEYESGTQVTLTASPRLASNYTFDYWALGASGSSNTVTITMNSDKTIGAYFKVVEPEPTPDEHDFTTYTDEIGLFSISYPSEWELGLEHIEEIEQFSRDIIGSNTSDLPLEEYAFLFMAGLPEDFNPRVVIGVEPLLEDTWTLDELVTSSIESLKEVTSDYHEFSRVKTTVDNRTVVITDFQGNVAQLGMYRQVQMYLIVGKTFWVVCGGTPPDGFDEWKDDFDAIFRSLRILDESS